MPDVLQFVDTIAAIPTVRMDLNDDIRWNVNYDGTSFDPPPRGVARAGTPLIDGERLSAGNYLNRRLRLRLELITPTAAAQFDELQRLHRELDRPFNFLRWQPAGTAQPVFFRTLWSADQSIEHYPGPGTLRIVDVQVEADPFAYGERVNLPFGFFRQDPATGGCVQDVAGDDILGDVPTPAILTIAAADVIGNGPSALAIRRRGTPSNLPGVLQAESMTLGTGATLQTNDATMSGGGSNYVRVSFGTPAMTDRLTSAVFPAVASRDARGMYRMFLRYRRSDATSVFKVELKQTSGTATATNTAVTLPATTDRRWADLGLFQLPFGADPVVFSVSGLERAARGTVFTVRAERVSGTGTLDLDCLYPVPADDRLALITWPTSTGPTSMIVDATPHIDMVYPIGSAGEVYAREHIDRSGGLPMLTPGQDTRIVFLLNAAGNASTVSDDLTSGIRMAVSYFPRYLYMRPATT